MKGKLTKRLVESIQVAGKDVFVWDTDLPMFGLKVTLTGRRVYLLQYRVQGRLRRYTIGLHGPITTEQARNEARRVLGEVASGEDPAGSKLEERQALTVADLAERYLAEHAVLKKKLSSVLKDRQWLKRFILPALGKIKVQDLTRQDVTKLQYSLRATPYQANRTIEVLRKMLNLAEKWGLRPDGSNPCRHVEKFKEKGRERFLSGAELARLGQALNEAESEGETPSAILCLRLLLATGARLGEILKLRWDEVDFERGVLNLPDSKTGAKLIPLAGPALNLLVETPRLAGNPFVCPGFKPGAPLVAITRAWYRIRERAGLDDVRIHDLRHSFASVAAAAGLGLPLIGALLGHTQAQTTKRYAHLALDPLKAAAEEVAKRIDAAMKQRPAPKVVAFRKKT